MTKRNDIKHILVIGAGPIVIGQACEFDYSGTQACQALMEDGYHVTLINSNPATIMTDPQTAHNIYIEPITREIVEKIIEKEKPDALLPTVGGQTALNCCMALHRSGVLEKHNIEILGAKPEVIECAEDRHKFNEVMSRIGLDVPKNAVVSSLEDALYMLENIGLPAIIRPSFTLGGAGSGIAYDLEQFKHIVEEGLKASPSGEVLIDESVLGWKEYEMEVIRDKKDNCIIICAIENIDPMGVHTGDSITVAPAQTLTDKEYQRMRNASIAVLRAVGIETGGSNVQFAINPENGRMLVIEMNPRVSRSSALASKATGFPIAKVAARLAVGYTLDEIENDITKTTPASFEPVLDYVVIKIPRFTFEKFKGVNPLLSSSMHSVGEVMSIGRRFTESLQKALCSMELGLTGLDSQFLPDAKNTYINAQLEEKLSQFLPNRLLLIADAFRQGWSVEKIHQITRYDPWYLHALEGLIGEEMQLQQQAKSLDNPLDALDQEKLFFLKKQGFSDARLAFLIGCKESVVREHRYQLGVHPVFKMIDTCAAEFDSHTSYLYSSYEGNCLTKTQCESRISKGKKVVILGSGPNRIGQGLEFDYACTHAALAASESGVESIMINCNPETVSTDYNISDKLYFEPLDLEHVTQVLHAEQQSGDLLGVVVQLGGQTPLKLAQDLQNMGFPILGTSPNSIALAEDRDQFKRLLNTLKLQQPVNRICHSVDNIEETVKQVGYPVIIRPSNVLGGQSMEILNMPSDLGRYLHYCRDYFLRLNGPILVDQFLENAMEIDVDALCDGRETYVAGIMEHIERAGVHSGDSASVLPTVNVSDEMLHNIEKTTNTLAKNLGVVGLMNVQYAIKNEQLYILEVNPRASRTVPFVAKTTGVFLAKLAMRLMLGEPLSAFNLKPLKLDYFCVKDVVFPFARFTVDDIVLRPEMQSTGEVMGIGKTFHHAFYKAQWSAGYNLKLIKNILVDFSAKYENEAKTLIDKILLTDVNVFVPSHIYPVLAPEQQSSVSELSYDEITKRIRAGGIQFLIDISSTYKNANLIRRMVYLHKVGHTTTLEMAMVVVNGLAQDIQVEVASLSEYTGVT